MKKTIRRNLVYVCAMLMASAVLAACSVSKDTTHMSQMQEELQQIVDDWRIQSNVPGVVVGFSLPNTAEMILTSGESDVKNHVPMQAGHQFQIASITKTFIAAEILSLAAEGKLQLDDPVNVYLAGIPHGDTVTIRHLLSHRSGYFDPIHDDPGFIPSLTEDLEREWTWDEMLKITFQHDLFFEPGSRYKYSNANYLLLALVIEKIAQRTLEDVLTARFISPLQLTHTRYRTVDTDIRQTNLAHGYATHPVSGDVVDTMTIPNIAILSVSTDTMISNAPNLLKWSRALYRKESTILEPALWEQMLTFDDISAYGLGVFQAQTPVGVAFGHGGDTAGYLSLMEYYPKQDLSMVILVNADALSINLSGLRNSLLTSLFEADQDFAIKSLLADLRSQNGSRRQEAIIALGHMNSSADEVIQALITVLEEDPIAENRKEAALVLGLVGSNSDSAKRALNAALQDEDDSVRGAAAIALSVIE